MSATLDLSADRTDRIWALSSVARSWPKLGALAGAAFVSSAAVVGTVAALTSSEPAAPAAPLLAVPVVGSPIVPATSAPAPAAPAPSPVAAPSSSASSASSSATDTSSSGASSETSDDDDDERSGSGSGSSVSQQVQAAQDRAEQRRSKAREMIDEMRERMGHHGPGKHRG